MQGLSLPPGFRFSPSEDEIVGYYLRRRVEGTLSEAERALVRDLDVLATEPWDVVAAASADDGSSAGGAECYAFWARERKYAMGQRTSRCTSRGYWKSTGSDRAVFGLGRKLGMKKTLVFYLGKAPRGEKTDWVMHEYRMQDDSCTASAPSIVACRIFRRAAFEGSSTSAASQLAQTEAGDRASTTPTQGPKVKDEPSGTATVGLPDLRRDMSSSSDGSTVGCSPQGQQDPERSWCLPGTPDQNENAGLGFWGVWEQQFEDWTQHFPNNDKELWQVKSGDTPWFSDETQYALL